MKNLIEKIEKIIVSLKRQYQNCFEEIDCPLFTSDEIKGKILAYQDCVNLLNQYNLITAPKSIKLSEIVSRLKNERNMVNSTISFCKHDNEIDVWEDYKINDDEETINGSTFIFTIDNNNIINTIARDDRIPKWLYTLWIAETEIVDDLKEGE